MPSPERPAAPVPLFFSYSKRDKALRDKLEAHLSLLQTQGVISGWHDRCIEAGTEWDRAISRHLEEAGIILLLVGADFLATRYCWDVEIKRAMERHEAGTARVIPVILRPVDAWHTAPFGKLQALPEKGKAVTTWKNRDEAFADIARGIREAAKSITSGTQNPPTPAQPASVATPPPAAQPRPIDRAAIVRTVSGLSPSDMAHLVTLVEGAGLHVSRHGTVREQAAELIGWAESPAGPGLGPIEEAAKELLPRPLDGPSPPSGTPPVGQLFWNVPHPRNPVFTGREDVLSDLRRRLTRQGRITLSQAISGLGGIGKTQTAVEYAYLQRDKYKAIIWLNAESPQELEAGCSDVLRRLQASRPKDDRDSVVHTFKDWLDCHRGWLLILDNADDPATLNSFLPNVEHGHVLITSRAQDFQKLGILDPIELPNLPLDDATQFLLRRCRREEADAKERDAALELAQELDGLPLALEQAAAYIYETKAQFQVYLKGYRRRRLELLEARGPALGCYPRSVVTTWATNFEAVQQESPAAADVLRLSAFLAPDNIPFELVSQGAPHLGPDVARVFAKEKDPLLVHDVLRPLARFSLIRIDGHRRVYNLHRLVQEVLKAAMDEKTRRNWCKRLVRSMDCAFPDINMSDCAFPDINMSDYRCSHRDIAELYPSASRLLYHATECIKIIDNYYKYKSTYCKSLNTKIDDYNYYHDQFVRDWIEATNYSGE